MKTRAKLVEQLRNHQIRSQHKCPALTIVSPKAHIVSWVDVVLAIFWAFVFTFHHACHIIPLDPVLWAPQAFFFHYMRWCFLHMPKNF